MYLDSDTPILASQRQSAACHAAESDRRIACAREMALRGRCRIFQTLTSPEQIAQGFGIGAAVNTAKLQRQSLDSRAALLQTRGGTEALPNISSETVIVKSPKMLPMRSYGDCGTGSDTGGQMTPDPTPGMPDRAPDIVDGPFGPMYFKGADATYQSGSQLGLTGYLPAWSDAWVQPGTGGSGAGDTGVVGWISDHPWMSLGIAALGVLAFSQRRKR